MNPEQYRDFLNLYQIRDGLLRENVLTGNFSEAIKDCENAILRRDEEIKALFDLQDHLKKEK